MPPAELHCKKHKGRKRKRKKKRKVKKEETTLRCTVRSRHWAGARFLSHYIPSTAALDALGPIFTTHLEVSMLLLILLPMSRTLMRLENLYTSLKIQPQWPFYIKPWFHRIGLWSHCFYCTFFPSYTILHMHTHTQKRYQSHTLLCLRGQSSHIEFHKDKDHSLVFTLYFQLQKIPSIV